LFISIFDCPLALAIDEILCYIESYVKSICSFYLCSILHLPLTQIGDDQGDTREEK
jgi:hypothetical protein